MNDVRAIEYIDLEQQWKIEREELLPIIDKVLSEGMWIGGNAISHFENLICKYTGAKHCVALNSGTDALVCALAASGVKAGDEVITPPNSFIASTSAISHLNAIPVFVDVLDDQSINPELVCKAITNKTKAIMPVHLTGRMSNMAQLKSLAEKFGIKLIEDAAQSIGSKYQNIQAGRFGDVGCFSTHPLKNLNACGDGGFIISDNSKIANEIKKMRNHGLVDRETVESFGYVSRMDTIQAAILSYRIKNLDKVIKKRRTNAMIYTKELDTNYVYFPEDDAMRYSTFHTFVIQVDNRDSLKNYLENNGIKTAIHYPIPIHLQPAARYLKFEKGDFIKTEEQATRILSLPVNQFLSPDDVKFIANKINGFFKSSK